MKNNPKNRGFTIIEAIVAISIIVILPAIIISNFPQIKNRFALSRVAYKFSQDLRMAQDLAMSSIPYKDAFGIEQKVSGYGIYIDRDILGNKKYIIYADASILHAANQFYDPMDYMVSEIDFSSDEKGVVIKEINNTLNNAASINFTPPNPDITITELTEGKTSVDIVFAMEEDMDQTRTVSVNTSGLIQIK